jgi:hypothetical protein
MGRVLHLNSDVRMDEAMSDYMALNRQLMAHHELILDPAFQQRVGEAWRRCSRLHRIRSWGRGL